MFGGGEAVRIPLIRSGRDNTPIAWWEWLFAPLVWTALLTLLLVLGVPSIPYYTLYPECHAHMLDYGTERQREVMRRYRRFAARVSFWRRCGHVLTSPFRRTRSRNRPERDTWPA
jgi:hypothetical protein